MTAVQRFVIGAVLGALIAAGAWAAIDGGDPPVAAATTLAPTTTGVPLVQEPDWILDGGVRFATTILVPDELAAGDGTIRLRYELVPIGQRNATFGESLPGALPATWELRLVDGTVIEATTAPPQVEFFNAGTIPADRRIRASVTFETAEATAADVDTVRVIGWRVPVPVVTEFMVSPEIGQQTELFDGSVVTLDTLLEQRSSTIIGFSMNRPAGAWRTEVDLPFRDSIVFRGAGPGWVSASSTIGGTSGGGSGGGSTGFQLTWGESTAPDEINVRFATTSWIAVDADTVVLGGGR